MPAMEKQAFGGIVIVHIVFWKYRCKNCVKACVYMNGRSVMIAVAWRCFLSLLYDSNYTDSLWAAESQSSMLTIWPSVFKSSF